MQWLQLQFDFDSTAIRRPFDCLSKDINGWSDKTSLAAELLAALTLTYMFINVNFFYQFKTLCKNDSSYIIQIKQRVS